MPAISVVVVSNCKKLNRKVRIMITEITNIMTTEGLEAVSYSNFWANILTIIWSCGFMVFYLVIPRLSQKYDRPTPSRIQLVCFSSLMALICWGVICLLFFISITPKAKIPWSLVGTLISFLIFVIFLFLILRKKVISFWAKSALGFLSALFLPLCAVSFAVGSTYLFSISSWSFILQLLGMLFFIYAGCHICTFSVAAVALEYEVRRLKKEHGGLLAEQHQLLAEQHRLKEELAKSLDEKNRLKKKHAELSTEQERLKQELQEQEENL